MHRMNDVYYYYYCLKYHSLIDHLRVYVDVETYDCKLMFEMKEDDDDEVNYDMYSLLNQLL